MDQKIILKETKSVCPICYKEIKAEIGSRCGIYNLENVKTECCFNMLLKNKDKDMPEDDSEY